MYAEITLRNTEHSKGCYDTIFVFDDSNKRFILSDGDLDSSVGDLEEYCTVKYSEINKVTELLKSMCDVQKIQISEEETTFVGKMENEELKTLFPYIVDYCKIKNNSMRSFMELLEKSGINCEYSAYRSGTWQCIIF